MRTRSVPVDTTSVWATYAQAAEYAANNGTDNYCPYDGQLVVTLEGYPDVSPSSPKYTEAHLWRLKYLDETTVGGKKRQHFRLDEVKSGDAVAGTDVHNIYTGTQRFGSWIELLAGMTMGFNLAIGYENGEPVVLTDDVTGQVKKLDEHGDPVTISDNDERIWLDSQGHAHMVISAIKVLGKMEVHEIDVNHIKHTGGLFVNSRANLIVSDVTEQAGGYTKLSFVQRNADGMAIYNLFEAGDLALSMTFNVVKEGASQPTGDEVVRFYWREVDSIGTDSQSGTGYIILKPVPSTYQSYMSTPQVGDSVVQVGHVDAPSGSDEDTVNHVKSRQGLQCMGFSHTNGPYIAEYDGIKSVAASVNFDRPDAAIVYLSPKYHKLQGDVIKLKATSQQGSTDLTLTADTIKTITQNLSVIANILDIQAGNVSATINGLDGRITANANAIALKADNKWLLKMTKDSAGMYVIGENGQPVANGGRMVLVANSDGSIGAVTIASNGTMTYTENFTLKASNVDFTAGAINMNTAKFTIGTDTNVTLFQSGKIKTDYIDVNTLKAALINAGIINAEQIVANALTATASFNADGATIRNLKVTGNSEFGGQLNGAGGTFSGNLSAAGGTFQGSISIADGKILIDGNEVNGVTNDSTQMHIGVNGLIAKVANALNQYLLANTGGIEMRWGDDGIKLSSNGLQRYINGGWVDMFAKPRTRAISGETTLTLQDQNIIVRGGSYFNITLPAGAPNGMQIMIKHTQVDSFVKIVPNTGQQISPTDEGNGKRLYNTDCCWLTMLDSVWYWNYAEV